MTVDLLHHTPLWVCAKAIRKCWASEGKSDSIEYEYQMYDWNNLEEPDTRPCNEKYTEVVCGEEDRKLIYRIGNKMKHKSTLEHLVYTFDIDGISRACLQEVARHRIASYSVKSTRYTLKELKDEAPFRVWNGNENGTSRDEEELRVKKYCVLHNNSFTDDYSILGDILSHISSELKDGRSNDEVKHMLPEAYKTSLVMTINARALQNFLELRTSKSALWEIRDLAYELYNNLPEEHRYLFEEYITEVS